MKLFLNCFDEAGCTILHCFSHLAFHQLAMDVGMRSSKVKLLCNVKLGLTS